MEWSELTKQADTVSPSQIKENLPVAYVLEQAGHLLVQKGDILACKCPFHNDSDPSFDVFDDGKRWGCFPCNVGGDVLDLIGKLEGLDKYGQQVERATELLEQLRNSSWTAPAVQQRRSVWEPEEVAARILRAQQADPGPLYQFLSDKAGSNPRLADVDPEDLRHTWGIGVEGDEIIVPYWTRTGELVAWKHRTADTEIRAASGSRLKGVLYGEWLDTDPSLPVLLCEGESDTWAAWSALDGYAVLGLSSGAGSHPNQAASLAGRRVVLAFDGDRAGRLATVEWTDALIKEGCTVELLPVPDGADLCKLPDIARTLERTRALKPSPDSIKPNGDTFIQPGDKTNRMITNWRFEPQVEMIGEKGTAYEGLLHPGGTPVTLTSGDLSNKGRIVAWCSAHGVSWLGSDRDAQQLLAWLQHLGPYLEQGTLVRYAGLYEGSFVWPGARIGSDRLVYTPPAFDVNLRQRLSLQDAPWTVAQIPELRKLHRPDVMDPVLAWLAAAPVRSLLASFPTLAVTGSSGSGKTTLLDTVVPAFSGAHITSNLTSTTRHAVSAFAASTNSFAVWFDEYRPGGRKDTMQFLEQVLRDAYTMQQSSKGGLGESWAEVSAMDTFAPLIVSGEDTFTETSHTERMVNLPLPVQGKNPQVLHEVRAWGTTGLPHAYLSWLVRRLPHLDLSVQPAGPEELPIRQRDNLGTLLLGWDLLSQFCMAHGLVLSDPDLSLVTGAGAEAATHNPIKDALLWLLDEPDAAGILRLNPEQGEILVRVTNFVTYINRNGSFTLPGRAAAVRRYLLDNYGGVEEERDFFNGKKVKCMVIRQDLVG